MAETQTGNSSDLLRTSTVNVTVFTGCNLPLHKLNNLKPKNASIKPCTYYTRCYALLNSQQIKYGLLSLLF